MRRRWGVTSPAALGLLAVALVPTAAPAQAAPHAVWAEARAGVDAGSSEHIPSPAPDPRSAGQAFVEGFERGATFGALAGAIVGLGAGWACSEEDASCLVTATVVGAAIGAAAAGLAFGLVEAARAGAEGEDVPAAELVAGPGGGGGTAIGLRVVF